MWRPSGVDRSTATFIALVVFGLVLVTVDLRAAGEGLGGTLRDGVQTAFTPVQQGVAWVTRPVVGFFEGISDLVGIRDENRRLRLQVADLERQRVEAGIETEASLVDRQQHFIFSRAQEHVGLRVAGQAFIVGQARGGARLWRGRGRSRTRQRLGLSRVEGFRERRDGRHKQGQSHAP